jgi:hypothetical protein
LVSVGSPAVSDGPVRLELVETEKFLT